jgi:hypothetical protein
MKKQIYAWALSAVAIVSGFTVVVVNENTTSASDSALQTQLKAEATSAVVQVQPVENPLHIDVTGPIEHYLWTHDGQRDEVWHNVNTDEWNIRAEAPNNIVKYGIYKDGYLYDAVYQNGKLDHAQKVAQAAGYTGKGSVFDGMKRKTVAANETTSTYAGYEVGIITEELRVTESKSITLKTYVDRQSRLPLKTEVTDSDGKTTVNQTWTYEYKQENEVPQDLFAIPADVEFKTL